MGVVGSSPGVVIGTSLVTGRVVPPATAGTMSHFPSTSGTLPTSASAGVDGLPFNLGRESAGGQKAFAQLVRVRGDFVRVVMTVMAQVGPGDERRTGQIAVAQICVQAEELRAPVAAFHTGLTEPPVLMKRSLDGVPAEYRGDSRPAVGAPVTSAPDERVGRVEALE